MTRGPDAGRVTVDHCDKNGTWLITLEGEHDLSTEPLIGQQTSEVLPQCSLVVVDVSQTTFVDSSVVNWIMRTRDTLDAPGGRALRLVAGPRSPAGRLLDILGLRSVLACYATREEALADVPPSAG
jgi:anti-anti-sigma factor